MRRDESKVLPRQSGAREAAARAIAAARARTGETESASRKMPSTSATGWSGSARVHEIAAATIATAIAAMRRARGAVERAKRITTATRKLVACDASGWSTSSAAIAATNATPVRLQIPQKA